MYCNIFKCHDVLIYKFIYLFMYLLMYLWCIYVFEVQKISPLISPRSSPLFFVLEVKIARRLKDVTKDVAYVAHGRATRREQEIELAPWRKHPWNPVESCGILWNPVRCSGFHRKYGDFPWEFSDPTKTIVIFRMKKNGPFCVMILGWGIPGNRPYEFVWTGYTMCPPFQRIMIDNPREGDGEVCGNWWGPLFLPNNCF